jgi:toxin ParE1/3/4
MTRYVLRPRARRDIENIWDYTAATWSQSQAEIYIRLIQRTLELLADDPRLGRAWDEIRAGYRKFRADSHIVFYRIIATSGIEVVRVLHESMDFEQHM